MPPIPNIPLYPFHHVPSASEERHAPKPNTSSTGCTIKSEFFPVEILPKNFENGEAWSGGDYVTFTTYASRYGSVTRSQLSSNNCLCGLSLSTTRQTHGQGVFRGKAYRITRVMPGSSRARQYIHPEWIKGVFTFEGGCEQR